MTKKQIKELFYSNGFDIYGPISYTDFCKNKYYKSTMIWHEGIAGWINICKVEELKHLVGNIATPNLDSIEPQKTLDLTPPLSKKINSITFSSKNNNKLWLTAGFILVALLIIWLVFDKKDKNETNLQTNNITDSLTINKSDSIKGNKSFDTIKMINDATLEAEKKTYRINWEKFITLKANNFRKKEFGGIDDLKLMVTNTSAYNIDFIKIYIEYLKSNKDTAQTEILEFYNVKPFETKEVFAPDSKRGVSVQSSIINIKSYDMNFCWDKKTKNKKGEDPFKCK